MNSPVQSGPRLDRLPVSRFHYRAFSIIAVGMFFDGFIVYIGAPVLGALVSAQFADLGQVPHFISWTFVGMMIGALFIGFIGDRLGRRIAYSFNLVLFGGASLAAAAAPTMDWLIAARFVMGLGLGAELIVGYSLLTEFVPPSSRGRWMSFMCLVVVLGFPAASLASLTIIAGLGWRPMFVIGGVGALLAAYMRRNLPESPRWLESKGRFAEAEEVLRTIEKEVSSAGGHLGPVVPAPPVAPRTFASLFGPDILPRLVVGCVTMITTNTLLFGFVTWLPVFFGQQGLNLTRSLAYTMVLAVGAVVGCLAGVLCADRFSRKRTLIGASIVTIASGTLYPYMDQATLLLPVAFILMIGIYTLTTLVFAIYTPELFPTEIRLRGSGFCHGAGRAATIVSPFIVLALFSSSGIGGVLALMIGLLVVQIVVVGIWGIETNQRSLEEIEDTSRR